MSTQPTLDTFVIKSNKTSNKRGRIDANLDNMDNNNKKRFKLTINNSNNQHMHKMHQKEVGQNILENNANENEFMINPESNI